MSELCQLNPLLLATQRVNTLRPPVWFMRQAGRYQATYRRLKKCYTFSEICKNPIVACEATLTPVAEFGFDAAILFSDLLFPLEAMGMGLDYIDGPKLSWQIERLSDLKRLQSGPNLVRKLQFQGDALSLVRNSLSPKKGLIGFVGGPLTLFFYAAMGSSRGCLDSARLGLTDGRFHGFSEKLMDLLADNMALQIRSGADMIAMMDTFGGEANSALYESCIAPILSELLNRFKEMCPKSPVLYYSRGTGPEHWRTLLKLPISGLGIDWRHELTDVLPVFGKHWSIYGNVDPQWLTLEPPQLEDRLRKVFTKVKALPAVDRAGWVCGIGHGVLPNTPESSIHLFLKLQREFFGE